VSIPAQLKRWIVLVRPRRSQNFMRSSYAWDEYTKAEAGRLARRLQKVNPFNTYRVAPSDRKISR